MKKLRISILLLIVVLCLCGCSSKINEKEEDVTNDSQEVIVPEEANKNPFENDFKDKGMMGTISEIDLDNNTITIKSNGFGMQGGNMPKGEQPSGDNQQPPEMPDGNQPSGGQPNGDNQQPPQMPGGQENFGQENKPDGQENFDPNNKPEGTDPQQMQNEENDVTYNVTLDTVIKDSSGNEITINDLKVDDFVEYTLDEEDILTINIIGFESMPEMPSSNS